MNGLATARHHPKTQIDLAILAERRNRLGLVQKAICLGLFLRYNPNVKQILLSKESVEYGARGTSHFHHDKRCVSGIRTGNTVSQVLGDLSQNILGKRPGLVLKQADLDRSQGRLRLSSLCRNSQRKESVGEKPRKNDQ